MGKILRRLLIVLIILVAALALTDRVANAVAERRVATEVADTAAEYDAHSDQRPDVTIHGWPFASQAWTGDFEQIDIELREVGAEELVFPALDMVARDVTADWRDFVEGEPRITAAEVDVSGTVSLASLQELLRERTGYDLVVNEDGTASVSTVIEALGVEVEIVGSGAIELTRDELRYVPDAVEAVSGRLPPEAEPYAEELRERVSTVIALPELPWGLRIDRIAIEEGAVSVSGSATDVPLT